MNDSPRSCVWGSFALGILAGVVLCFATALFSVRNRKFSPDAGMETEHVFTILFVVGPGISALLALVSFWQRERPRWPAVICVILALYPLAEWLHFLIRYHRFH